MSTIPAFVQSYKGKKLAILATGGGVALGRLATVPGASGVLHNFYCPYATEETIRFVAAWHHGPSAFRASAVSPGAAYELYEAMATKYPDANVLVVTAALTSTRWRRGENRAYIACKNPMGVVEVWHLRLPKATEEEHKLFNFETLCRLREMEDEGITNVALHLVNNTTSVLEGLMADGTLVCCNP